MEDNLYKPPATQELESQEITFLREAVPRPFAVWILLAAFAIFIAFFAVKVAGFLWVVLAHKNEIRNAAGLAVAIVWHLFLMAVFFALVIGIYRGTQWSRWVGVVAIVGFAVVALLQPDTTRYANEAERTGGLLGRLVVFPLLFAWWAYSFGFSSKAKKYFSQRSPK